LHEAAVLQENLVNDLFFVAEVIIQIARADPQMSRNMVGGNSAFAMLVKKFEAGLYNPVVGFDSWHVWPCSGKYGRDR
jgi:hypothetical protein